jgi:hypothetical protein
MEYGPEFDDLRGDYSSVEERLEALEDKAEGGEDGNGRLADYFEREQSMLERELELRLSAPDHKPEAVPSAYQLYDQDSWSERAQDEGANPDL